MEKIFNAISFDDQKLECPNCSWKGEGSEAVIIDLYGVTNTREIHSPECDAYLGGLKMPE